MSNILARKGSIYLLAVGVVTALALISTQHEATRRATWDQLPSRVYGSSSSKAPLAIEELYVDLSHDLQETTYHGGVAGFNMMANLYLHDGAFVVVTSNPDDFPESKTIITGDRTVPDDRASPGEDYYIVLTPAQARQRMGTLAIRKSGLTLFFNDASAGTGVSSFLTHYYHSEMFLGAWMVFTSGFPDPTGEYEVPKRIMYRTEADDWRDPARLITWLQQAMLPDAYIEDGGIWSDRELSRIPYKFDKISLADRPAAHRYGKECWRWNKVTGDLPSVHVLDNWMNPLRNRMKKLAFASHCKLDRPAPDVPMVTYIDRQRHGRKFVEPDAKALLDAMWDLDARGIIRFYDAIMEETPGIEQVCIALRTDIMMGIHGNGLTHQMWMKPNSVVIEMMDIGGFAMDYALPAGLFKHDYYPIHNDTVFPKDKWLQPDGGGAPQSPGFHGNGIRINAPFMSELITKITKERSWADEPVLL